MHKSGLAVGAAMVVVVGTGGVYSAAHGEQRAAGGEVVVHVAPPGGASAKSANTVSSLAAAQQVLKAEGATKATVLVRGGTYRGETLTWDYSPAGGEITIAPQPGTGEVVYDAQGRGGYWATVRPGSAKIHFRGMTVQGYTAGGILFRGDKASGKRITGGSVRNMTFRKLGTKYGPGKEGYGGVHLYHSFNMRIERNDFWYLENDKNPGRIHGVYFSDGGGRGSTVKGNTFYKVSGDPVRVSDGASYIGVSGNKFKSTGYYGIFSSWRFSRDPVCGKGNTFSGNTYGNGYKRSGKKVPSFKGKPINWDKKGTRKACKPAPIKLGKGNRYAPNAKFRPVN